MALFGIFKDYLAQQLEFTPDTAEAFTYLEQQVFGKTFKVDYFVTNEEHLIFCELPGVDKNDISVQFTRAGLVISGKRPSSPLPTGTDASSTHKELNERLSGSFSRTIPLADGYDEENVSAKMENGILTIKIPRTIKKSSNITIE